MDLLEAGLPVAAFIFQLFGAIVCTIAAGLVLRAGDRSRPDRMPTIAALCITASWCVLSAAFTSAAAGVTIAETARNLAWIYVLFRLFSADGRDLILAPIRPVVLAIVFVECLQPVVLVLGLRLGGSEHVTALTAQVSGLLHVLVSIGALVLLHNLYAGASSGTRQALRWSAAALAGMWVYDLNYYTTAYLLAALPVELAALRGLVAGTMAVLLAIGMNSGSAGLRIKPSRAVAFQTLSLAVIGVYLLVMVAIAQSFTTLGSGFGRLTQVGFILAAAVLALLWLPSERTRRWLRVTVLKHLFQHRYDYRAEWLRFTRTIGRGGDSAQNLPERVVQALADIADSPSGLLLAASDDTSMELTARWQWPTLEVPADPLPQELAALLERDGFILDLDEARQGKCHNGEAELVPDWLRDDPSAWALVPLLHFDRLVGIVVLGRAAGGRRLDWEDFDLLKIAGQQLASYLAEQAGQQALMEATRFDEFNRRIAFVMHDIKNLASQLSLLARNAERHADNTDFRADMLLTLRASAEKLNALLARLGRYGTSNSDRRENVELGWIASRVAARFAATYKVTIVRKDDCRVLVDPEALEQALVHLVQNAIDASDADAPVYLDIASDGLHGRIEIVDMGAGMSPQFVRNGLFKPFVSNKEGGFGIGAFEARELVSAMGGRVDVESREGLGTRFTVRLPIAAAAELLTGAERASLETA